MVFAQPTLDVTLQNSVCLEENIGIVNNSTGFDEYEWDFCVGDFNVEPTVTSTTMADLNFGSGFELVEDEGRWYAFVVDRGAGREVFRYDFGENPLNNPIITKLDLSPDLFDVPPEDISIIKFNDLWYGVVAYRNSGGSIIRLDFGSELTNNSPAEVNLGSFGFANEIRYVELIIESDNLIMVLSLNRGMNLWRVNYGDSFDNVIDTDTDIIKTTAPEADLNRLMGIDIKIINNNYIVHSVALNAAKIMRLNFGSSLLNIPIWEATYDFTGPTTSHDIELIREGDNFYGYVTNPSSSPIVFDFGDLTTVQQPVEINFATSPPTSVALDMFRYQGRTYAYGVNTSRYIEIEHYFDCAVSVEFSNEFAPDIFYMEDGIYEVALSGFNTDVENHLINTVSVSTDTAPSISFSNQNICQSSPVLFTSESPSSGLVYSWDFGDATTSIEENPSHTYAAAGVYEVTLEVSNGTCGNFTRQTITVYDEPVPTFSAPGGLICTNQMLNITNTTLGDFGDNETWEWQIDGSTVSSERDLEFTFPTGGMKEIKLIASIPGCSAELIQNINVEKGPSPAFVAENVCVGTLMQFNNASIGQIDTYLWDFDNGFTSSLENPSFEYAEPGSYNVSLTVENSAGCITTYETLAVVFASPEIQFSNDLSCERNVTQFNDLSEVDSANLVQWQWNFGDPDSGGSTSSEQNATHVFSRSGTFDVKLVATSGFGCRDSLTQTISVLSAPQADFTFDKACIGEPIQFQDTSVPVVGESITSFEWDIAGVFSNQQNPEVTLGGAGNYDVTLFTTSENLCLGTANKVISIAQPPSLMIGTGAKCENEPVKFYDLSETNGDAISSWEWNFDNQGSSSDSIAFFDFEEAGSFNIGLQVITENGCEFGVQEQVTVNMAPQAIFNVSSMFGAPPLQIDFENLSQNATNYLWNFDGEAESNALEPQFIFNELGEYNPQLIAFSEDGCTDTTSQQVFVLIPEIAIQLNSLILPEDNNSPVILGISNNGTLSVIQLTVVIDLGGQVELKEVITTQLAPGQTINYPLELTISDRNIDYICVELVSELEGITESNTSDNSLCETFSQNPITISNPFPNPTTQLLNVEVVSAESNTIVLRILDSTGALVKEFEIPVRQGFETIEMDLRELDQGIYFLQIPELNRTQMIHIIR
ncbi:MAG: PKD domain-containing protein [Bacteroidota bacterium]